MSKLLPRDVLEATTPHRLVLQWVIDATTGRPVSHWVREPSLTLATDRLSRLLRA